MAKKVKDARAAKDARQKKIAIVGLVLFIAVAAFQVPRTMKLLKGPETPAAAPAATAPAPGGSTSSLEPPSLTGGAATATGAAAPAAAASGAGNNTLVTFGRFESKDPFRPQVDPSNLGGENPAEATAPAGAATVPGAASGGQGATPPVTSMPRVTTPAVRPTSAVISVNGVPEVVAAGADFPALEPTFKLVSLTAKAAKIAIAGGSYANGDPTVTLKRGQTLTLMNTSDGRRYQLKWLPDSAAPTAAPTAFTPATTPAAPAPTGS
jgi:hypothetical protein